MKVYKCLYYNLYKMWLKKKDEPQNARINAVMTITILLYVNIISVPLVALAFYKKEIIHLPDISMKVKLCIATCLIVIGILNFVLLGRKKQHNKIVKKFKAIEKNNKQNGYYFTIMYLIISLGIPLYVFLFTTPPMP